MSRFLVNSGKAAAMLTMAISAYFGAIDPAFSPAVDRHVELLAPQITPSLSYAGTDVIITGSVHQMFESFTFVGPNRAEKRNRALPENGAVVVASVFDGIRQHLAAQRTAVAPPPPPGLREFIKTQTNPDSSDLAPIAVASIDPVLLSAALAAIEKATPGLPAPLRMTETLAYARADTPATVFNTPTSMRVSDKQFDCLATAIYFEARGESYRGQAAVAQVVLNRVKHKVYPNTICSVVYQNQHRRNACQFSFACDGIPESVTEPTAWAQAREIAAKVLNGEIYLTEVANATHYHATYVRPDWAPRMRKMTKIGLHVFYRFRAG